jgi:iron complex outermembrane receptor protein
MRMPHQWLLRSVVVNGTAHATDGQGNIGPTRVGGEQLRISVIKEGFSPVTTSVQIVRGQEQRVLIELSALLEEEVTVIASTRTERRIEDQPMRVEVLAREEIEQKLMMTPGDIVMMLNEMGGLRVQSTSPSLRSVERSNSRDARPLHPLPFRWPSSVRGAGRSWSAYKFHPWILGRSK